MRSIVNPNSRCLPYRWELVLWLWLAFFLNQGDRQIFSIVLPQLKLQLALNDVQLGLVASVFAVAVAVCTPLAGLVGDRWDRRRILVVSVLGWSVMTVITGFASSLPMLILVRSLATGAGEAFYAPAAYALMGQHHVETRARAMAIHQTALYVGIVATGFASGWLADHYGWRAAFWVFGAAGVVVGALCAWRLKPAPPVARRSEVALVEVLRTLLHTPTAWMVTFSFGCLVFVNVGYLTWMPTYLHERFGLRLTQAGFWSVFTHHLLAFAGVAVGGVVSDVLARRVARRRLDVQAAGLLLGAPFLYILGVADTLAGVLVALALFGFFRGLYDSNNYASLYEVVAPRVHSTASGVYICVAFAIGSIAPVLLGWVSQQWGMARGLSALAAVYVAGALALIIASTLYFDRDHQRVNQTI